MLFVIESDSFVMCLAGYKRIPYEAIHEFWKSLSWDHVPAAANTVSLNHGLEIEIENLTAYFRGLNSNGQAMVRRKVQAIYCPESSSLCSPEVRITSKRTPREKKSKPPRSEPIGSLKRIPSSWETVDQEIEEARKDLDPPKRKKLPTRKSWTEIYKPQFPSFFQPYIQKVDNVSSDGNCGYRCVAALLGHASGQEGWPWVREELIAELEQNRDLYEYMWGMHVYETHNRLTLCPGAAANLDKWMVMTDMGYLIATRFQVVVVSISMEGCNTYLPMRGAGPPPSQHGVIAIGHVPRHFVQV